MHALPALLNVQATNRRISAPQMNESSDHNYPQKICVLESLLSKPAAASPTTPWQCQRTTRMSDGSCGHRRQRWRSQCSGHEQSFPRAHLPRRLKHISYYVSIMTIEGSPTSLLIHRSSLSVGSVAALFNGQSAYPRNRSAGTIPAFPGPWRLGGPSSSRPARNADR
jgi:hypothetical protein